MLQLLSKDRRASITNWHTCRPADGGSSCEGDRAERPAFLTGGHYKGLVSLLGAMFASGMGWWIEIGLGWL
jgi:hypothetical protein